MLVPDVASEKADPTLNRKATNFDEVFL